jgi:serine 3-dehydrogenase/3-hydroxy acid dehydrogenase/malonic semialdehyde reductase
VRLKGRCGRRQGLRRHHPLTAEDIANTAYWIATLPPHVNINRIDMMPTCQGLRPAEHQARAVIRKPLLQSLARG